MYLSLSLIFMLAFAATHFFSKYMTFITDIPRSKYLSLAGGIAVSYVFLHLLPELGESHESLSVSEGELFSYITNNVYLLALAGLFIFYALDRIVSSGKSNRAESSNSNIFWVHIASFFVYNSLIGYLLVKESFHDIRGMVLYFLAMVVHFVTVDHNLRDAHQKAYDSYGRWLLTAAIIIGWLVGVFTEVTEYFITFIDAFLAGGIILNVMKEELPEERESSLGAFTIGVFAYSIILLFME